MDMDAVVTCPECKRDETYGDMHWRDGKQYCRICIAEIWRKDYETRKKLSEDRR